MAYRLFKRSRLFRSLLYRFNNISLHRKIILSYFLFVFLLVGVLAVSIYTFTSASIIQQNTFSLEQSFHQADSYLTYKFNGISSSSDMLIYNVTLNNILSKNPAAFSSPDEISDSRTILSLLKNMEENEDIKRARLYVPDALSYSGNNVNICAFSQARLADWWEPLFKKKGIHLFVGNDMLEDSPYLNQKRIALIRAMYCQDDYSRLSFILRLDVPLSTIEEILNSANYTNDSITMLLDQSGNIVAGSNLSGNFQITASELEEIFALSSGPEEIILGSHKYMALMSQMENTGWNMLTLVPYDSFTMAVTSLVRILLVASLLILVLAYVISKPIAYTITKRIDALCRYMQKTKDGSLEEVTEVYYKDEIGILYENYNFMISRIRNLLNENYMMGIELKSAEFKALQSQINPHFLYNTLDTIIWLAEDNQTDQVVSMVTSLSEFFRTTLSEGRDFITIKEEETHIRSYLQIQQFRYRDILDYVIEIPQELYGYTIMKLTIQPLVENALYHGIKNKRGKGVIQVSAKQKENKIEIVVEDNGIGMKPAQLKELRSKLAGLKKSRGGFGLVNVQERIQLHYGEEYGLFFESTYEEGTKVTVRIPPDIERK